MAECLVWRKGWRQWLPIDRVQRFAKMIGDRARAPVEPIIDLNQNSPPPVPAFSGFAIASKAISTPVPPPHHRRALVRRPPVPTIAEGGMHVGGDTLRPPGAVPPPPRGTPKFALGEEARDSSLGEYPEAGASAGAGHSTPSLRPSAGSLRQLALGTGSVVPARGAALVQATQVDERIEALPKEELSSPQQAASDLPTALYDPDAFDARPATPGWRLRPWSQIAWSKRSKWSTVSIATAAIACLCSGFWLTLHPSPEPLAKPTIAPVPSTTPPKPLGCTVSHAAQRIASNVLISVLPVASDTLIGGRMLLGFAESPTVAAGITVDPVDLDVAFPFREASDQRIVSVVPLASAGAAAFRTLRENPSIRQGRVVDAKPEFLFGIGESGFVRQSSGGNLETVWAVDPKSNLTDPRIASFVGQGHAVTFRQGGQTGTLMLGWLTDEGLPQSGPFQVKSPVTNVGNPAVAMTDTGAMLAYAGRATESDAWSIYLTLADFGKPPRPPTRFEQPSEGSSGDSISPSVATLTRQRWLLQWSEGTAGQRQVRIQTLDRDGHPLDVAHTVSPVGSNSGQGLLWSHGQRAVSLFAVGIGRSAELWAAPIYCPE